MVLFHVKATGKSFLSWQKAQQWFFFDGVRNAEGCLYILQLSVYTTAKKKKKKKKEFRTIVFLIF